jgi:undecaprenyl pyrophosphate phosphatase UppP
VLLRFVRSNSFGVFVTYRLVLAIGVLVFLLAR